MGCEWGQLSKLPSANQHISSLTMPASCTVTHPASRAPVPRTLGYTAYLDDNVFTHLDMALMDHRDVVPFTMSEYPSRAEVTVSILNVSFRIV